MAPACSPARTAAIRITVTGSYYGKVAELKQSVQVAIPMELDGLHIVSMAGVKVPFTLENGKLTFKAEAVGLFLLVPAG